MQVWRSETLDNPKRGRLWIQILQQTSCFIIFTYFRGHWLSKIFEAKELRGFILLAAANSKISINKHLKVIVVNLSVVFRSPNSPNPKDSNGLLKEIE